MITRTVTALVTAALASATAVTALTGPAAAESAQRARCPERNFCVYQHSGYGGASFWARRSYPSWNKQRATVRRLVNEDSSAFNQWKKLRAAIYSEPALGGFITVCTRPDAGFKKFAGSDNDNGEGHVSTTRC
ncbi:hypothetical protein Aph01nite_10330 [Acrocarpospora phusangensis]|uniref:Peptidase inhibitor family I36 n=1 Tax=Acrocarpospora phusangensis TaxID=1070424 RepID=A0A919Q8B5_9ACTN|nr:peptidase inhibitor family I36 protein [Acrocarpospora phusangensis]GIH22723.1 hypothetical protein Aph01nite_10330 [Acrocarpospora phusangensis]